MNSCAELLRRPHLHGHQTKTPGTSPRGFSLHQTLIDYAAFFLRHPSRPNPARPVAKSGSAAGSGTADTPNGDVMNSPSKNVLGPVKDCSVHDKESKVGVRVLMVIGKVELSTVNPVNTWPPEKIKFDRVIVVVPEHAYMPQATEAVIPMTN